MPNITLKQFAKKMGVAPPTISRARKKGILDAALVPIKGKKRVLIDLAKGKKLYNANHDPNFRKREQLKRGQKNNKKGMKPAAKRNGGKPKVKKKREVKLITLIYHPGPNWKNIRQQKKGWPLKLSRACG